ncbi:MAG TPA: hypothetical protein VEN81_11520 [Planctomycetota bacterium]|nr:hypothetical protein [Planctomycetota bacterium]
MNITLSPREAGALSEVSARALQGARELSRFQETDPGLAGACGVEVGALEARTILGSGAVGRLWEAGAAAYRSGRPAVVRGEDLEALSRLEGVLALGASRIGQKVAELDGAQGEDLGAKLSGLISLATGAIGLWKSIF